MKKVCCQFSPFSHVQVRGDPCTNPVQICLKRRISSRDSENLRIRILLERQKEQSRRYQLLLEEELSEQNRALRETRIRNMRDMEELQKSHVLKVEELSRRKLTEDQNTIMELRAKIQELQNEVNCMNDSRVFKRCRVSTQWVIPRSQSTSVTSTLS